MNLFKALFGSSFFQQEMKRNQQYRDNYACCDDIDVNIDFAEEIEDEIQNEKLFLSDYIPESYLLLFSISEEDIPEDKRILYKTLCTSIKEDLIEKL